MQHCFHYVDLSEVRHMHSPALDATRLPDSAAILCKVGCKLLPYAKNALGAVAHPGQTQASTLQLGKLGTVHGKPA